MTMSLPVTFAEFLQTFRDELSREVLRRFPPLYQMNGRAFALAADRLARRPFPAQFHAAAAIATTLQTYRSALIVGEPSVGKTITALASAVMIGAKRVLVLAPAHLLAKWGREIRLTVPGARVIEIQRLRDIRPALTYPARENAPVFCLLSRDQAKLGAPWHHSALPCYLLDVRAHRIGRPKGFAARCDRCGVETRGGRICRQCVRLPLTTRISDRSAAHPRVVRDDTGLLVVVFRCPRCAQLLRDRVDAEDMQEGEEPRIWTQADFEAGPQACPFCKEPLLQYDRLRGGRGLYPLARYLGRRHRKAFDLLIVDEGHQYKSRGTAQG